MKEFLLSSKLQLLSRRKTAVQVGHAKDRNIGTYALTLSNRPARFSLFEPDLGTLGQLLKIMEKEHGLHPSLKSALISYTAIRRMATAFVCAPRRGHRYL
jgi:hypothetical protein